MKILHLIVNEKFFNFVPKIFSELDDVENRYVALIRFAGDSSLTYISNLPLWRVVGREYVTSSKVQDDLGWCDVLIVHLLHPLAAEVILKAPPSVKVVWSGWGGDYYDLLPGGEACLLGDDTAALLAKLRKTPRRRMRSAANVLKKTLKRLFLQSLTDLQAIKFAAIKRMNYFSSPIQDDYVLLKRALGEFFGADYVQLNYGIFAEIFKKGQGGLTGDDILLGNSATATNNHVEAIRLLSSIELGDRKIVVPLSYGDDQYGDFIERYGIRLLGENFMPIRKFMPIDEYNELISRCSIVIMNHRRQQALGNICTMLYFGAKLFMDHRSIVYKFFKGHGASVFSIQDIIQLRDKAFSPISYAEKKKNIEVVESFWSHEVVMDNARKFVKLIQQSRRGCA